jgi:hypothetical protein
MIPASVAADDPNDVVKGADNATTAQTSITQSATGFVAFKGRTVNTDRAGLVGSTGDEADSQEAFSTYTGVYGFAQGDDAQGLGSGVWGDSPDTGVVGSGFYGVYGTGVAGVWGDGIGGPGVIADTNTATMPAVLARGASASGLGLHVVGKVRFSRSGRVTIGSGKSTYKVTLAGVTSSSRVFAILHSNRSNRFVRAVVPTTGSFTIYLNATLTSAAYVAWFVLD